MIRFQPFPLFLPPLTRFFFPLLRCTALHRRTFTVPFPRAQVPEARDLYSDQERAALLASPRNLLEGDLQFAFIPLGLPFLFLEYPPGLRWIFRPDNSSD